MSVGFIGLGNIGKPMAKHLLKLGEPVYVDDLAPGPVAELVRLGAQAAAPQAIAGQCRIVGLCVRDDGDVEALLHGDAGLLNHMQPDSVLAVHSTVTQASILRWAGEAKGKGIHLVDAPITGGAAGAEAGTLAYMVGGAAELVERCRPVFATSGRKIIHAGPPGAGIALKLCNNLITYAAFAAMHEADALARAAGLDPALLAEVGRANGVVTPQMEAFIGNRSQLAAAGPETLHKAFGPFGALGRKDLLAALASAEQLGLKLPATERLAELIEGVFLGHSGR
ncbi:MAG TPA: NAD(P)-dependent oxidoreductase [Nevskia sp.]|nr:NAD(P)-dependent oxidoreductase [Nevskia sp.]